MKGMENNNETAIGFEKKEGEGLIETPENLVALIRKHFSDAYSYKESTVKNRLNDCLQRFSSQYPPEKLAQIREIGGSEIYIPLTNMKVRAGKAWLVDIFFQPNESLFDLKPTPMPDLPDNVEAEMKDELYKEIIEPIQSALNLSMLSGGQFDMTPVLEVVKRRREEIKDEFLKKVYDRAEKICAREKKRIEDQFTEGGFYSEFSKVLHDIVIYPTAILKGVVLRKVRRFVTNNRTVVELTIPTYNRVSPFDIFPARNATNFDDGYLIEVIHLTPQQLYELIGVEGFIEDNIRTVIGLYGDTGYREAMLSGGEKEILEGDTQLQPDTIDVLEYWGNVKGEYLKEWGVKGVDDDDAYYDICAWLVDNYLLKVVLNPDPLGKKPYTKASFIEIPDSFWGIALPEILAPIQDAVNAIARAVVNNSVLSSGALIERNIDRIDKSASKQIIPFQMFDVHESALNNAPAYRFYQLQITSDRLMQVLAFFQKMADEYSGIPAYAHGDITVGGAGRALADYQKVLTIDGFKRIDEIDVGDKVANTKGGFSTVKGVFPQGTMEIFKVTFSDGRLVFCTEDHIWAVKRAGDDIFTTKITKELMESNEAWELPEVAPLEFPERDVAIDPFVMGLTFGSATPTTVSILMDEEYADEILKYIPYRLVRKVTPAYYKSQTRRKIQFFAKALAGLYKSYRVNTEYIIHRDYLFTSIKNRIELLQGVMEACGDVSKEGYAVATIKSQHFYSAFMWLLHSLGCQVIRAFPDFTLRKNDQDKLRWGAKIFFVADFPVFKLERRNRNLKSKKDTPPMPVVITSIEPYFSYTATCIEVDSPDHLYLCDNCIPTHNTASGLAMLQTHATRGVKDVVKNIDDGIIEPIVKMQYYFNLYKYLNNEQDVPDLSICARGSINLMEKESQSQKLLQFLQITNNPIDTQLVGAEGRKQILQKIASNLGIDVEDVFKAERIDMNQLLGQAGFPPQMNAPEQTPTAKPTELSPVTEMAQGKRMEVQE